MAPEGWYPDPTGRAGQRWHDGARWTDHVIGPDGDAYDDPFEPMAPAAAAHTQVQSQLQSAPGAPAPSGAPDTAATVSIAGIVVVALGALLALAGFFALDWADGGAGFGDIRDAVDRGFISDTGLEIYFNIAGFLGLAATVILGAVAVAAPGRNTSRSPLTLAAAAAAGASAIYHGWAVAKLFQGPIDAKFGAWAPAVGYVVIIAGLSIALLTTCGPTPGKKSSGLAIGVGAVGVIAILAIIATAVVIGDGDSALVPTPAGTSTDGGSGSDGASASVEPADGTDSSSGPGVADDAAIEGLMSTLDGDAGSQAPSPSHGSPAWQLAEFLDAAGDGGQRTVRLQDDVIEVCGAGLGSACLQLSNFVLDDSGFSIADMDVNGERLSARLRFEATAVPPANPNGVISITAKGQLAVPDGPTIVVLILKQYDERIAQNNGCDGNTATLSTAGPSTTHQGGGADKGSFLGNSMVINFPTTASVGGTVEMDCYTAEGAAEHHTVQLPG